MMNYWLKNMCISELFSDIHGLFMVKVDPKDGKNDPLQEKSSRVFYFSNFKMRILGMLSISPKPYLISVVGKRHHSSQCVQVPFGLYQYCFVLPKRPSIQTLHSIKVHTRAIRAYYQLYYCAFCHNFNKAKRLLAIARLGYSRLNLTG